MDNKSFLENIVRSSELDKETCVSLIESFCGIMEETIASGDSISVPSFGNFEPRKRNERVMSHPSQPGKKILVPPKVVLSFKPSAVLKNRINTSENDE